MPFVILHYKRLIFVTTPISEELKNKTNATKLKKVEDLDLFVVNKGFLDDVANFGYSEKLLNKHNLCSWGTFGKFYILTSIRNLKFKEHKNN